MKHPQCVWQPRGDTRIGQTRPSNMPEEVQDSKTNNINIPPTEQLLNNYWTTTEQLTEQPTEQLQRSSQTRVRVLK